MASLTTTRTAKIHKKTLFVIAAGVVLLVGAIFLVSWATVMGGFSNLEKTFVQKNISRSQEILQDRLRGLSVKLGDWTTWDDTYAFIDDKNEAYVKSNLPANALETLQIDMMMFFNLRGEFVYFVGRDNQLIPEEFKKKLIPGSALLTHADEKSFHGGIVALSKASVEVVSKPIIKSDGNGPIRGTVLFAKYLDAKELKSMGDTIKVDLDAQRIDAATLPPDFSAASEAFRQGKDVFIEEQGSKTIAGYSVLKDIFGKPVLILKVTMPREIMQFGRKTLTYFYIALIIAGFIFGAVVYVPLESQIAGKDKAEKVLRESKDLLSEMTAQVPGVLYQLYARSGGELGFYYVSDMSERILGVKSDLMGSVERFVSLVIPEHREGFMKSIEKSVKELSPWKYEGMLLKPTGEKIWFSGNSNPSPRENEVVFNGIITDITERKKVEDAVKAVNRELENKIDALGRSNRQMKERELRIIEVKKEVNKLSEELGRPAPYGA